jgi:hypothetical protein
MGAVYAIREVEDSLISSILINRRAEEKEERDWTLMEGVCERRAG